MSLSIIDAFFNAGKTIVVRPIPEVQGGGYTMYPLDDPLNNVDFVTTTEVYQYLDGFKKPYAARWGHGFSVRFSLTKETT